MNDYELEQAKADLESAKDNFQNFLIQSYQNSKFSDPQASTEQTMKYLESILDKIIKRQAINIEFLNGASPGWYSEIFKYFSLWLEQEIRVGELMSKHFANDT